MRVMFLFCSPPPWAKVLIIPHIKSHGQNAVCLKSAAELPGSRFGEQMDGILAFSKGTSYLRHWGFQWIGVNISGQPTLHCEAVIPSQFKYCRHKFSKKHPLLVQMLLWFGSWTNTFFLFLSFSLFGVWPSGKKKSSQVGLENWAQRWQTGGVTFSLPDAPRREGGQGLCIFLLRRKTVRNCKRDSIHLRKSCGSLAVEGASQSPHRWGPFSAWDRHSCHWLGCSELRASIHTAACSRVHSGLPGILPGKKEKPKQLRHAFNYTITFWKWTR